MTPALGQHGLGDIAALRAAKYEPIVGTGIGTDAKAENPGAKTRDLENVSGARRE